MDPPSPIHRDLSTEQILEDMINDGADVDPAESLSTLDGSSDGKADSSSDGESDNSDDGEAGEVYIYEVRRI